MVMVDRVEASKNLEILKANQVRLMNYSHLFSSHAFKESCSAELSKYQNLSRSGLTRAEMLAIDGIMIKLKERIKNLRTALYT